MDDKKLQWQRILRDQEEAILLEKMEHEEWEERRRLMTLWEKSNLKYLAIQGRREELQRSLDRRRA